MTENTQVFKGLLSEYWPELSQDSQERVLEFYRLVIDENDKQNLTRLTTPMDFIEGHVLDVRELLETGFLKYPAVDLGSGVGVPGLLAALLSQESWILAESEGQKAGFLKAAAQKLGLEKQARVYSGRAEQFLESSGEVGSVVARAVGPVERIYSWIRKCSTWNTLVLLKGPRWETEWKDFSEGRYRKELRIAASHDYSVGKEEKKRVIVSLVRV